MRQFSILTIADMTPRHRMRIARNHLENREYGKVCPYHVPASPDLMAKSWEVSGILPPISVTFATLAQCPAQPRHLIGQAFALCYSRRRDHENTRQPLGRRRCARPSRLLWVGVGPAEPGAVGRRSPAGRTLAGHPAAGDSVVAPNRADRSSLSQGALARATCRL